MIVQLAARDGILVFVCRTLSMLGVRSRNATLPTLPVFSVLLKERPGNDRADIIYILSFSQKAFFLYNNTI